MKKFSYTDTVAAIKTYIREHIELRIKLELPYPVMKDNLIQHTISYLESMQEENNTNYKLDIRKIVNEVVLCVVK